MEGYSSISSTHTYPNDSSLTDDDEYGQSLPNGEVQVFAFESVADTDESKPQLAKAEPEATDPAPDPTRTTNPLLKAVGIELAWGTAPTFRDGGTVFKATFGAVEAVIKSAIGSGGFSIGATVSWSPELIPSRPVGAYLTDFTAMQPSLPPEKSQELPKLHLSK